jgi:hypothetical protein
MIMWETGVEVCNNVLVKPLPLKAAVVGHQVDDTRDVIVQRNMSKVSMV